MRSVLLSFWEIIHDTRLVNKNISIENKYRM